MNSNVYDDRDLRKFRTDDTYVCTFIRGPERLDEGVDLVHESLRFRKEFEVNGEISCLIFLDFISMITSVLHSVHVTVSKIAK